MLKSFFKCFTIRSRCHLLWIKTTTAQIITNKKEKITTKIYSRKYIYIYIYSDIYILILTHIYIHTHTHIHIYLHTHVKTPCIILKLRRDAELKKVKLNTSKKFISLPTENFKTSTVDFRLPPKNLYEWILKYKVKKCLDQKKKFKKSNKKKLILTLKSVYITVAKFHYFHHRKFQNFHLQPLPPNNPNLFTVFYLRFLDDKRLYEKILRRQLCQKSLCCLPPNLNKF